MCLAGLLEYTWAALSGSLAAAHSWGPAPTFWLFSFFVIFESFVQIGTGYLRNRGILTVRWATMIGGLVCGIIGYLILAESTTIWTAYLGYAVLGGIGSGMVYSSCINIVAKWYPEKKGWRTGFVNGGWAYGSVPFIIVIGGFRTGAGIGRMSPRRSRPSSGPGDLHDRPHRHGRLVPEGPAEELVAEGDRPARLEEATPGTCGTTLALRHYSLGQMWRTPQAKWIGIQYALFIGCSLFGVAYYYSFAEAMGLG